MLQFQAGEYCICIWDGEQTELGKALESLGRYTEDEQAARGHKGFTVTVWTLDRGSDDGKAKKILEETGEAGQTLYEIADMVTACLNLVRALGCTAEEFQKQLDMVDESNTRKGRQK